MIGIEERQARASRLARIFCTDCKRGMKCSTDAKTGKSTHGCEGCWVYILMNSIVEGEDIE